jgi:hypothetical protein
MKMTAWNTYYTGGYTHDVANDQASAGGVHLHQVRRTLAGWQRRIVQSNGRHQAYGAVESISKEDGADKYASALQDNS